MDYWANVVNIILIYFMLGTSLNLVLGFSGMVSMAQAVYFGVGAYAVALLSLYFGLDYISASIVAILFAGLFAAITAFPALRVRDEYLILLTLALQMIASGVMDTWISVTGGPSGIPGIPPIGVGDFYLMDSTSILPVMLVAALIVYLVAQRITRSPLGRTLKALRENESAAVAVGKNIVWLKVLVFGVSGVIAGLAGVLFAGEQGFIDPMSFNLDTSILLVALVALGGAANLFGTLIGAALILGLPEVLTFFNLGSTDTVSAMRGIVFGLLLIIFTRFRPQGIIPESCMNHKLFNKKIKNALQDQPADAILDHPSKTDGSVDETEVLKIINLDKQFGGVVTADKVNIVLKPGLVTALIGPNGAGKTTIFNLLAGVIKPDGGEILLNGKNITEMPAWKRMYEGIGRSFQDVRIFERISVIENVLVAIPGQSGEKISNLFLHARKVALDENKYLRQAMALLEQVDLSDKAFELAGDLSYGEQKLLAIARLVATGSEVLLFDEPAAGVDAAWGKKMIDIIRALAKSGKSICLVEHNLNVVKELADTVYFMNAGAIVTQGSPEQIMRNSELAEIYFGQEAIKD